MGVVGLLLLACAGPAEGPKGGETARPDETGGDDTGDTAPEGPTWHRDADGDGYGDPAITVVTGTPDAGWVLDGTDCDDTDAEVFPGAAERCNAVDDDCDGRADHGVVEEWHSDVDGDGWGDPDYAVHTCLPEDGWILDGSDCWPGDAEAHPGATEACDGEDDDCDGAIDEGMDADGDGHRTDACVDGDDCDDADAGVFPGGAEVCEDGIDGDCDGADLACGFDGVYDLAAADAKLYAASPNHYAGGSLAVGDPTGDGVDDLVVATLRAGNLGGGGYVVSGAWSGDVALDDAGPQVLGDPDVTYGAGRSIGVADVNGDGVDDIGFGAPYGTAPGVFLVLGPVTDDVDLAGDHDVLLAGPASSFAGHGSDLGDVNGDGYADALVGAYHAGRRSGSLYAGAAYVAYGPFATGTDVDLETGADAAITAESDAWYTGYAVRAGADLDGDGVGDLLVTAPFSSFGGTYGGALYVVYGPPDALLDLGDADGRRVADSASDQLGEAVNAGDVDGDGLADALVCAPGDATVGEGAGAAYVFLGPVAGTDDVTSAEVTIHGGSVDALMCASIAASDIDGDGRGDVLAGAVGDSLAGPLFGGAYLFYGPSGGYTAADADAIFTGPTVSSYTGMAVGLADLDADGRGEVYIGAPGDTTGGSSAGAVYTMYPR